MNEYTIGSGNRASLSTGAPLGEYAKVGSFTADLVFFGGGGGLPRGNLEGGFFMGDFKIH